MDANIVWTAIDLSNVRTDLLWTFLGQAAIGSVIYRTLRDELSYRRAMER